MVDLVETKMVDALILAIDSVTVAWPPLLFLLDESLIPILPEI
jgi:hypothetical protein